ncbi:disease resistance protein RUN1-like [Carya illinoinensis]|uniref:disease resistance protein RUN1-like n=1 Tax=Carya illinoinensis TaxID=32201 RepID=UPI001C71E60F|nr:disease resistance protein RUN1-like [Carya illinoinensis]
MAFQLVASSSFSCPSIHLWNHDVFLNFRGKDVRHNFISHLKRALRQSGIKTYMDGVDLERGEQISLELFKAIEESQISIIVLSKNYAESRWCLDELLKILECKKIKKQIVLPIFYKVKPSEVREQKGRFGEAFIKLGKEIKDAKKPLLESWKEALEEVANLSGLEYLAIGDDESEFIQKIILWVNPKIVNRTPLSVAKHPIGIESRIRDIYQRLSIERNDIIRVLGIFGTGGIGKTTIANDIYNQISSQFEGCCFLTNIRETSKQVRGLIQLQNTLLSEILGTKLDINDVDKGVHVIGRRLQSKRILLILDDVDDLVQLEKLVGDCAWFGYGSRVIITTRDQHILDNYEVDSKYEVMTLDDNEALQLFSLHAFEEKEPLEDYMDLSKQVIKYAQGLPLALTVLGSDLKGRNIDQWKSALDKYRKIPHRKIQNVLQISYDSLEVSEKEMFLDIAFFFKGEPLAKIMEIFDSCGFYPVHGIQRLMEKCLITTIPVNDVDVRMHDLLQNMGREIEREKSSKDPSKRNRLWFHEDVREVLEEDMGPNEIEGMVIDLPEGDEEIRLHPEAFRHMKRLRILINRNARFSHGPNYLSEKLRVLDWYNYPLPYLPHNFQGKNLIVFRMHDSIIKELGDGFKPKNLTTMAFTCCSYLTEIPDLSSTPNLKELTLQHCRRLFKVHESVGSLEYLSNLDFHRCSKLRILPRSLKLRSLCRLDLGCCSSLRDLPEIECKMESLHELVLKGTAVEELPLSIGNIVGLEQLYLTDCKNLMHLPIALIQLQYLRWLCIAGCTNIVKNMWDDGQSLDLPNDSTTMEDNISNSSTALQVSNIQISCSHSESNFFPLYCFFTMFNSSTSLHSLDLSETDIVSLPTNIKEFITLTHLDFRNCHKLEEIAELPPNIRTVYVEGCKSLERFSEVSEILEFNGSHIKSLERIDLSDCDKMHENIWNDKVQNPLLWKGLYDYVHEFLDNEMEKGPDDDARQRGTEEWAIDIEGPHYLEDISGIVLYVVLFFHGGNGWQRIDRDVKITSKGSNHVCSVQKGVELVNRD